MEMTKSATSPSLARHIVEIGLAAEEITACTISLLSKVYQAFQKEMVHLSEKIRTSLHNRTEDLQKSKLFTTFKQFSLLLGAAASLLASSYSYNPLFHLGSIAVALVPLVHNFITSHIQEREHPYLYQLLQISSLGLGTVSLTSLLAYFLPGWGILGNSFKQNIVETGFSMFTLILGSLSVFYKAKNSLNEAEWKHLEYLMEKIRMESKKVVDCIEENCKSHAFTVSTLLNTLSVWINSSKNILQQ